MNLQDIDLPTNRKFGSFFTAVSTLVIIYFYWRTLYVAAVFFALLAALLLIITLLNDRLLLPLNKLWVRLGWVLGRIISPIVMVVIFFAVITPVALIVRFGGCISSDLI